MKCNHLIPCLSSIALANKRINCFSDLGGLISKGLGAGVSAAGAGASALGKAVTGISENFPEIVGGGLGLAGLLALIGGTTGTMHGYRDAAKSDTDKLQSERYLNEFLARRHAEGTPIQSVPVPVKINKANTMRPVIKPIGDVTKKLDSEA